MSNLEPILVSNNTDLPSIDADSGGDAPAPAPAPVPAPAPAPTPASKSTAGIRWTEARVSTLLDCYEKLKTDPNIQLKDDYEMWESIAHSLNHQTTHFQNAITSEQIKDKIINLKKSLHKKKNHNKQSGKDKKKLTGLEKQLLRIQKASENDPASIPKKATKKVTKKREMPNELLLSLKRENAELRKKNSRLRSMLLKNEDLPKICKLLKDVAHQHSNSTSAVQFVQDWIGRGCSWIVGRFISRTLASAPADLKET